MQRYIAMRIPKASRTLFFQHLTQRRDAFFWRAGDRGLIYFTDIHPGVDCEFNVLFWDGRLTRDRLVVCSHALNIAFADFAVPRISARTMEHNRPIRRFLRDLGFLVEGTTRRGWVEIPGETYYDLIRFGLLPNEVKQWQ